MEGKGRNRLVFVQLIQQKSIQVSLLGCFFIAHFVFPSENRISFLIPHAFRFAVITTEEFEHLFDWKRVKEEVKVIQPLFYVDKGDTIKVVSVHAKSCRGAMTRYIIQNRLSHPSDILDFELEGFKYDKDYGDASHPHFIKR